MVYSAPFTTVHVVSIVEKQTLLSSCVVSVVRMIAFGFSPPED
jgi:hypothetical protein